MVTGLPPRRSGPVRAAFWTSSTPTSSSSKAETSKASAASGAALLFSLMGCAFPGGPLRSRHDDRLAGHREVDRDLRDVVRRAVLVLVLGDERLEVVDLAVGVGDRDRVRV